MPLRPCLGSSRYPPGHTLTTGSRCPECRAARNRQRDAQRGSTTARGYGTQHQQLRAQWAPHVEAGTIDCWRCGQRIQPGDEWDLGHDQGQHRGPEHARQCNRAEGGRQAHA